MFKFAILIFCIFAYSAVECQSVPKLESFRELGKHHCKITDLPLLYRITSGNLAEIYGPSFKEYDAYIRSFVGPDFYYRQDQRDEDQEEENPYKNDEVVEEYVQGLNDCGLNWTQKHVYQIWRYIRFMINSDYLFEWLRAKMRISYGYEIQKPNAWMDGQQREERLRLEKLYSNQYLYSLQDLMHRDYLYPILTTLRKNIVIAAGGHYTKSGKPLLVNVWETRNYPTDLFFPVQINLDGENFFSFTIPGIPLLLSGSSQNVAWAFSGILVDRTNVEQIQTTGMRFFDQDNQRWIKIKKITDSIKVKGEQDHNVTYHWSKDGPLISKSDSKSKIRQFIVKWHQNQPKVRVIFSELVNLLKNPNHRPVLHFPFNSLLLVDNKGIHHHVCPPRFAYYFLYPDMLGEPENFDNKQLWASNPKRGFFVVANTRLSSTKPLGYLDRQVFNSDEQSFVSLLRELKEKKKDLFSILQSVVSNCQTANAKKIVDNLLTIYRKAKFTYLPDETIRNQNDQLVAMLDKWDNKVNNPKLGSIYRMWLYFLKMNTFGHSARSNFARDIARFKLSTDTYFAGQTQLWKGVASYGECNIDQYNDKIEIHVNHTGHNSSCYYNILKSINQTRQFFTSQGGDLLNTDSSYYNQKKTWNPLTEKFYEKVSDGDSAFHNTFKQKLIIGVELGSEIVFSNDGIGSLKKFEFGSSKQWTEQQYLKHGSNQQQTIEIPQIVNLWQNQKIKQIIAEPQVEQDEEL